MTGCSVQVGPEAFEAVDRARPPRRQRGQGRVPRGARGAACGCRRPRAAVDRPLPTLSGVEAVAATPLDGVADDRASVERTRAFVKVQDGCSFFCTYCIIPRARGPERSLAPDVVLADVRRALAAGHREIVLTGINIGTYDGGWSERGARGSHARSALTLAGLVRRILDETAVERIRLSSIEPQHVDDELLAAWVDGAPRTLPHLHLPLQSGDDGVLRRMGRRYLTADYARVVARARAAIPGVAIHADVIAGFPTEDDARARPVARVHRAPRARRAPRVPLLGAARDARDPDGRPGRRARRRRRGRPTCSRSAPRRRHGSRARAIGTTTRVLLEQRLADGRWVGHAEDHVLVAVTPRPRRSRGSRERHRHRAPDRRRPRRARPRHRASRSPRPRAAYASPGDPRPRQPIVRRRPCPAHRPELPMPADCLFCRIVAGEIPATRLHEDDLVIAIRDINPQAPTHVLVLPVRHIASAADLGDEDGALLGRLFGVAATLAAREGLDNGWRLVTNVGSDGGQSVDHLHLHLLGGRAMAWPPG